MPVQALQMGYNGRYRRDAAVIGIDADTPRMAIREPIRAARRGDWITGRHDSSDTAGRHDGPTGDEGDGQGLRYDIGGHGTAGATGDTTQKDTDMGTIDMDTDTDMDTDMGFETGMTTGKPRKAYAFDGLGLRDDEACLAATMRAEELGLYDPHDAEVLREDELTSYVLLKAGDKTDVPVPAPLPGGMPTLGGNEAGKGTVRHGSPQIIIGVTCGIDENGDVRAYAGAPFPATRRNIETITQSCDGTRRYASSRYLETEWPGGIIYDYAPSRYLYGGETRLMQICDIERILACGAETLATPGGSLTIPTDPTPLDALRRRPCSPWRPATCCSSCRKKATTTVCTMQHGYPTRERTGQSSRPARRRTEGPRTPSRGPSRNTAPSSFRCVAMRNTTRGTRRYTPCT